MDVRKMRNELLGKRLVAALESRNMEAYYVETKEEAVKKALEAIDGVTVNEVSHEKGIAAVSLSKDVPDDVLKKAVEDKGYTVTEIK